MQFNFSKRHASNCETLLCKNKEWHYHGSFDINRTRLLYTWRVSKPIRLHVSVSMHDRSYDMYVHHDKALCRSCIRWNIIIWYFSAGSARKVRPLSRESALVKGFRKTRTRLPRTLVSAWPCISFIRSHYPGMIVVCVIYVRTIRCARAILRAIVCVPVHAWMYSRTRRSSQRRIRLDHRHGPSRWSSWKGNCI